MPAASPAPRISVIMSVFDDAPFLAATMESVLAQTFADFEYLVLDDGSADGSGSILADYAARDPRIRVIESRRKGRVPALNALLAEVRAPLVALIDSDDICLPDRLALQHACMEARPEIGCLGGHASLIDTEGRPLARPAIRRPLEHEDILAHASAGILLLHSTMMARAHDLRAIGGYREPFRTSQDYDLYLRLAEHTQLANLPDTLALYRVHPKQVSSSRLIQQTLAAAVAWYSHEARMAGRADPIEGRDTLPALEDLDSLFGQAGLAADARRRIVDRVMFSPDLLAGEARPILRQHVRESRARPELWRAAARMGRAGHVAPALATLAGLLRVRFA